MAKWIWKFGDMEKYHNLLVHSRRQNYGYMEPVTWKMYQPEPVAEFRRRIKTDGGAIEVRALGTYSVALRPVDSLGRMEDKYWGASRIELPAGDWELRIRIANHDTFPALYVTGIVESDASWEAGDTSENCERVGTSPLFEEAARTPDAFPFRYDRIEPRAVRPSGKGMLYDYGRESFARLSLTGLKGEVFVSFGESEEEALDVELSVIHERRKPDEAGIVQLPACAFRYVYVETAGEGAVSIEASQEMLDLTPRASFTCDEDVINRVYETAVYTFWLNSREFFLDGIKRDRWVWSADAYQSMYVNHYLFMDREIEKRTFTALGGGLPVVQYINTIMDYTYFWLIGLWDYYVTYGDQEFLAQIYPQAKAHMLFCNGRRSEDGLIRGQKGDWVFIDWAPMDKDGALLGEQILLAAAMEAFGKISALVTGDAGDWQEQADALRAKILGLYYDSARGVFIDSFESGRKNVTRQNNLLAYLYLGIPEAQKKSIYQNVILNDAVAPITTPYFKFYENRVICEEGDAVKLEESLREYYGGMLAFGATSLYEQYDPTQTGAEHYAMYGRPYEKSLCHAWSCSPIYLLGAYRCGVKNTGIGYDTFEVAPKAGDMKSFTGVVPLPDGEVRVSLDEQEIRVLATAPGGTLVVGQERLPLEAGVERVVKR